MNSYTASKARAVTSISKDSLKSLVNNKLLTANISKSDHRRQTPIYWFTNLVEMAVAKKLSEYCITRPKLIRQWLPKVPKALKLRANLLVCRSDGSVTYYAGKKKLDGLKTGVVIHFSSILLDLLIRTGENLEESSLAKTNATPRKSRAVSIHQKTASA